MINQNTEVQQHGYKIVGEIGYCGENKKNLVVDDLQLSNYKSLEVHARVTH